MKVKRVVTFGEIMARLSTPGFERFVQANNFNCTYGGGEANVAVSLANYGIEAFFVSVVPDNPLGQAAINHLRRYGVFTEHVLKGEGRLGIYFLETGASQRPSNVIYDRAGSAVSKAGVSKYDWQLIFEGVDWFHFTGITPALGKEAAEATLAACRLAKAAGVRVSCDLNYRKKLWSPLEARQTMSRLMPYVDVVIANEEDAEQVFGISAQRSRVNSGALNRDDYRDVAKALLEQFAMERVAITLRESHSATMNGWSGLLFDGKKFYHSREYAIHIVDRIGGGDSFAAGLIYALLNDLDGQLAVEFAAGASCLKHSISGDFNMVTVDEVMALVKGDSSGRVRR